MTRLLQFQAVLAAAFLVACAPSREEDARVDTAATGQVACTMIGCEDQLVLHLDTALVGPFRILLEIPNAGGDSARKEFECPAGQRCNDVPFPGFTPERVTVRVIKGRDTTTRMLQPEYQVVYPNGPQCPPGCRIARDTVPGPR